MKRTHTMRLAAALLGVSLIAAACGDDGGESSDTTAAGGSTETTAAGNGSDTTAASAQGGEFIDGAQLQADNLTSFDPGQVQTLDESQVTTALYDGLTDFDFTDKKNPVLKGLVAEKWESNADATEFTFTIKKGLVFSNGDPVLPSSFKYAWVRNGQDDFASPYGYLIDFVKDGTKLQAGEVENLDATIIADDTAMTLKVTMEAPFADFPSVVSHPFFGPLPEKVVSALSDQTQWDKGLMIGNGPFMMAQPKNDTEIVLVPNAKWAGNVLGDTAPKLSKLTFKIMKDVNSAYTAFEAGEVMNSTIPSGKYGDALAKYPNTVASPTLGSYHYDFGFTDPILGGEKNVKLRQAISLAIDREQINQKVYEGARKIATSITMTGIPGFKEGLCKYCAYDPDGAKKLLDEWKAAGNTLSGPITIDFNTGAGHEDVVAIIQENLKAVGIESTTNPVSEKYFSVMPKGGCHLCRAGWYADYPTYGNFMLDLYSHTAVGGNNMGSFDDPKFNDLLAQAEAEPDEAKRAALFNQAEDYLLNVETGAVPIVWYSGDQVFSDKVTGYDQPPLGIILWEQVGLKA